MFSACRANASFDYPRGSLGTYLVNHQTPSRTQARSWLVDLSRRVGNLEVTVRLPHSPVFKKQNKQISSSIEIKWMKELLLR